VIVLQKNAIKSGINFAIAACASKSLKWGAFGPTEMFWGKPMPGTATMLVRDIDKAHYNLDSWLHATRFFPSRGRKIVGHSQD
jgi:hypothetical protein